MLHSINLLPWREQELQIRLRNFIATSTITIVAACLLLWTFAHQIDLQQQIQQQRLDFLNTYLTKLNQRQVEFELLTAQQQRLQTQLQKLSDLQWQRNQPILLMQLLASQIPQGVYLDNVMLKDQQVTIKGFAQSTEQLTQLLERFETSAQATQVVMHSIQHNQESRGKKNQVYHLSFTLPLQSKLLEERIDEH